MEQVSTKKLIYSAALPFACPLRVDTFEKLRPGMNKNEYESGLKVQRTVSFALTRLPRTESFGPLKDSLTS